MQEKPSNKHNLNKPVLNPFSSPIRFNSKNIILFSNKSNLLSQTNNLLKLDNQSTQKNKYQHTKPDALLSNVIERRSPDYNYNFSWRKPDSIFSREASDKKHNNRVIKNNCLVDDVDIAQFKKIAEQLYGDKPGQKRQQLFSPRFNNTKIAHTKFNCQVSKISSDNSCTKFIQADQKE